MSLIVVVKKYPVRVGRREYKFEILISCSEGIWLVVCYVVVIVSESLITDNLSAFHRYLYHRWLQTEGS